MIGGPGGGSQLIHISCASRSVVRCLAEARAQNLPKSSIHLDQRWRFVRLARGVGDPHQLTKVAAHYRQDGPEDDAMCCFLASLVFVGPRLAFIVYLLFPYGQMKAAMAFNTLIWPLLGWAFLPWTTLMYMVVYPVYGWSWFLVGLGLVADIATYAAAARQRQDVPYYSGP
jgi:hypothetical protein